MRQTEASSLLESLLPIARLAGGVVMDVYAGGQVGVALKEGRSPVTQADLSAHKVLVRHLQCLLSDCPVVSEEAESSHECRRQDGRFWLIDPLDGTKEFISGNGEFTVNIALVEEGRSVLGVVYAPAIDALYWGGPNVGAWRCLGGEVVSIRVTEPTDSAVCRVVASRSHLNAETQTLIHRLGPVSFAQAGSSLKFCRVAEGLADLYPRLAPTCEWDTAAAQAVLEGAGGIVIDLHGRPLRCSKPSVLNPSFIAASSADWIPE